MKKITLLFTGILFYAFAFAQSPQLQWSKNYGGAEDDYAFEIEVCADGYLIAGHTKSFGHANDNYDFYLIRIDEQGEVLWTRTYGGSQDELLFSCKQTHDGDYILSGVTQSWGLGGSDGYVLKVDRNGDSLWSKYYGGDTWDQFYCGIPTVKQGYVFTGYSSVYMQGDQLYMVGTKGDGDTSWTYKVGGDNQDYGYYVLQIMDGQDYITVGHTWSEGDESQVYLVMTDKDGYWTWTKAFGGPLEEYAIWMDVTDEPGYIIVGSTQSYGHGSDDFWLVNTDNEGTPMDTYTFGGGSSEVAVGASRDVDGDILIAGNTWSFGVQAPDMYMMKVTEDGDSIWSLSWGGQNWEYAYEIKPTLDGGYIVVGREYDVVSGDNDIVVLKYGPQAMIHYVFAERHGLHIPIPSNSYILDTITVDLPTNSIVKGVVIYLDTILHGQTYALQGGLIHLDDHRMLFNRPQGKGPNFINTVLHPAANISIHAGKAPYTGIYRPLNIPMGSGIVTAENEWILNINDLGSGLSDGTLEAGRIQVFYEGAIGLAEAPEEETVTMEIYPNPCADAVRLRYLISDSGSLGTARDRHLIFDLYDISGRKIYEIINEEKAAGNFEVSVDVSNLPAGIYFVRLQSGNSIVVRKLLIYD